MTPEQYIDNQLGDSPNYTLSKGKLAMILEGYANEPELDASPEIEAMRDKFNHWLDGRINRVKSPTNWIDITAEFVLEQLKEREPEWADIVE